MYVRTVTHTKNYKSVHTLCVYTFFMSTRKIKTVHIKTCKVYTHCVFLQINTKTTREKHVENLIYKQTNKMYKITKDKTKK